MNRFRLIILSALALHLSAINTNLLINLTTYFKTDDKGVQIILALLFSLPYSLGTFYTLNRKDVTWLKVLFALLDGCAVGLWYNSKLSGTFYIWVVSAFYMLYTILVALGVGLRAKEKPEKEVKAEIIYKSNPFLKIYVSGFILYIKWLYNKTKEAEKLEIAKEFGVLIEELDVEVNTFTVQNKEEIINDIKRVINETRRSVKN